MHIPQIKYSLFLLLSFFILASQEKMYSQIVRIEKGKIKLVALDKKNSNSNESSIIVGETDLEFTAYVKAENMKIIPGEYDVALSKAKIAHFINKKVKVQYWIALEADSTF